ncbi:MAG: hypothetical protein ACLGGV_08350, partial [Bacteroidia bacterium]
MKTFLLSATLFLSISFSAQVAQSELILASTKYGYLDVNNVKAIVPNGSLLWLNRSTGNAGYTINEFDDRAIAYSGNIWIGAKTSGGILKLAAGRYMQGDDFYVGPYSKSGTQIDFQKYDRVWKLSRAEVLEFKDRYNDPDYTIPEAILTWPAHGDESLGQAKNLAPFHDTDGNGIYNPIKGDYPEFDF